MTVATTCSGHSPACIFYADGKCKRDKCNLTVNCGWSDQELCPSYEPSPDSDSVSVWSGTTVSTTPEPKEFMEPKESMEKNVNHPKRYTKGKIECIDALESAVAGKTPEEAVYVANVIKYLWRYEEKEPLRSLLSARWYLDRLISKYEITACIKSK